MGLTGSFSVEPGGLYGCDVGNGTHSQVEGFPDNTGRRAGSLPAVQVIASMAWMGRTVAVSPGRGPPEVTVLQPSRVRWSRAQIRQAKGHDRLPAPKLSCCLTLGALPCSFHTMDLPPHRVLGEGCGVLAKGPLRSLSLGVASMAPPGPEVCNCTLCPGTC